MIKLRATLLRVIAFLGLVVLATTSGCILPPEGYSYNSGSDWSNTPQPPVSPLEGRTSGNASAPGIR